MADDSQRTKVKGKSEGRKFARPRKLSTQSPARGPIGPGFPDVEAATRYLLSRAEELVRDGVVPRRPVDLYLDALVPVLGFIYARPKIFAEANLGPQICGAVEQIAQEIQSSPDVVMDSSPPKHSPVQEAVSTAALLLTAYRDAVRRVARGPKGLALKEALCVSEPLDLHDPQQVADSIETFLRAADTRREPLSEAGISDSQLKGLAAQRRVILGRLKQQLDAGTPTRKQVRTTQVLHAALEYFFDRFSAAVSAKLVDHPEDRVKGLRLVPRDPSGRKGGQRSTDPR